MKLNHVSRKGSTRRRPLIRLLAVCLCIVGFVWVWYYPTPFTSYHGPLSFQIKRRTIENEIAGLKGHPWAGSYFVGDGHWNTLLTLAPENGFTMAFMMDVIDCSQYHHGTVNWDGNHVKLSFKTDHSDYEFTPIRWGERNYLVAAEDILDFCNAINSGDEPRTHIFAWRFFLRRGDEDKEVQGKPELPEEFMAHLLNEPVEAAIVSLKNTRAGKHPNWEIVTFVVDKGKKDGLLPGMMLHITGPGNIYQRGKLTHVEEAYSEWELDFGAGFVFPHGVYERYTPHTTDGWQSWKLSTLPNRDPAESITIPWGERVYEVPTHKILDFCNAVNSGDEPRTYHSGCFTFRYEDEKREAHGKPELPEEFQAYLLDEPVEAKIVSIKEAGEYHAIFVVDKGKKDGLLPGMVLHITEPDNIYQQGKIARVEETSSELEIHFSGGWAVFPRRVSNRTVQRSADGWEHWQLSTLPKLDKFPNHSKPCPTKPSSPISPPLKNRSTPSSASTDSSTKSSTSSRNGMIPKPTTASRRSPSTAIRSPAPPG